MLVRRGGSVAVARAVHRKMRLSPNTSATTSFRAERRIISKECYTILCNVVLMNNFVLFLQKFGLGSPEKFSAASVIFLSPIPSLRALWEQACTRLVWNERGKRSLWCLRTHLAARLTCLVKRAGGGWKCVSALPTHAQAQLLPATVLQPWANQLCKKGAGLVPPENVTLAVCPTMVSEELVCFRKCCRLCKHCGRHGKGHADFSKPCKKGCPKICFSLFLQHQKPKYVRSIFHANRFCTTRKILNQQILLGKQIPIKINEASFPLVSMAFCYTLNSLMKKYFTCI